MQSNSRTLASVVGTMLMVVVTVLLAQWSTSVPLPPRTAESARTVVVGN